MNKKPIISASDDIIQNLRILAMEKEDVRQKLAITAEKLAETAKKLAITAKEKESVRRKLVITADKLAATAKKLAATAKEKEDVRRKLVVTAKEKESVRQKLVITAEKLKKSHETLEKKVLERTKSLKIIQAKQGAVLLSIGDGLIATNEKGEIILINKTAEKLLGNESDEVVGKSYKEISLLKDAKGTMVSIDKHPVNMALKTGAITTGTIYYNVRKDGTKFPVSITVTPVILGTKVIGTIKIFRDITYEREIDKAKTEFVSLASHQLRTPLSTVNWYTEMLLAGDVGELNEKQKKYLDEVYNSNQRMVELVNALLDVSRLELGTFVIEPKLTDICKLAQNVINEQRPQIDTKKIRFTFHCENEKMLLQADPKLLRMVIQNVLSNSVKYTQEGGKVKLSITVQDKKNILLRTSDNGYGIPKNQHSEIFTKLFRADNVRDKDTNGTGLGLYIVKSIVENSGGKIWFESPKENEGTTFYVTMPIKGLEKKIK